MKILITGAAGMIGRKLAARFAGDAALSGTPIDHLVLVDVTPPEAPAGLAGRVETKATDISNKRDVTGLVAGRPDVIFHLAAIVSGEAELDFDKGYRINLDGTGYLLEAIRAERDYRPKLVFASSIAVFGAPFPEAIPDDFFHTPLTSYGTQKAIAELLIADYARRGFLHGIAIRLPTIVVRPGKPNRAASGFFSSIIREPLAGEEAILPVEESVRHWHASPRAAVGFLLHAASLAGPQLGARIGLTMPGVCCTVGEEIAALRRIAGDRVAARIRREPDPMIMRIVEGWPRRFDARRAIALGFRAEDSFDEIIRAHIDDELGGRVAA
ncbi:MAG: SDR family oxidoreductase [Xanthobacteraceae bacterium]|nr:SDR family oxidoreductase [Xanthobacteraceae bacterium]